MIRNIITLTLNDLAIAIKNKTIFLIFFIPLFVFFTLKMIDPKASELKQVNLGLIKNGNYTPVIANSLKATNNIFNLIYVENNIEGIKQIKEKKLDGLLLESRELIVFKKESISTLSTVESFNALQRASEGNSNWITNIKAIQTSDVQKESLPTWILMLILLVGFVIMPSQVAEEKEKKLLLSLLQTPMKESEWLMAKVLMGVILSLTSILLLHLMGNFKTGLNLHYVFMIFIGSFCFSSYGVLLGFLCRNQASARILGVIFYLPHLLPSALSDFSSKMNSVAPILPSYHFYESIKLILFEQASISSFTLQTSYLILIGLIAFIGSHFLMKKRWLM